MVDKMTDMIGASVAQVVVVRFQPAHVLSFCARLDRGIRVICSSGEKMLKWAEEVLLKVLRNSQHQNSIVLPQGL